MRSGTFIFLLWSLSMGGCAPSGTPATDSPLHQDLATERDRLESLQQSLNALRAQRTQQEERQAAASAEARIEEGQSQIQALNETLAEQRFAERDLAEAAQAELRTQAYVSEAGQSKIEAYLRLLQDSIQGTQARLADLTFNDRGQPEDRERRAELQDLLANQRRSVEELRAQKVEMADALAAQSRALHDFALSRRDELAASREDLLDRIVSVREDLALIESRRQQQRMSLMSLDQQIHQLERSVQEQSRRVQWLENSAQIQ